MQAATTAPEAPRKLSLAELNEQWQRIMAEADDGDGEVTPELAARLDAFESDYETKCEAYAHLITLRAAKVKATEHVVKVYSERLGRDQRSVDALKSRLYDSLKATGRTKVETPTATVAIQANGGQPALVITGEVPAEYTRTTVEPDNAKIREALAGKKPLDFAKLERGEHLRIK